MTNDLKDSIGLSTATAICGFNLRIPVFTTQLKNKQISAQLTLNFRPVNLR